MKSIILHVLIDTEDKEDVFRDIEISADSTLDVLHQAILDAFNFTGSEIASFYDADAYWDKGQEYPQMAMEEKDEHLMMHLWKVGDFFKENGDKAIYVYDFLRMWSFLIEKINANDNADITKPKVLLSVGEAPNELEREIALDNFEGEGGETFDEEGMEDDDFGMDEDESYDFRY